MRWSGVLVVIVVGVVWASTTTDRVQAWSDERALWASAVAHAPEKPRPWVNLGRQYALMGLPALARDAYETASQAAQDPRRSLDERILGWAIAETNIALLEVAQGNRWAAEQRLTIVRRHARIGSVEQVYTWLTGPE